MVKPTNLNNRSIDVATLVKVGIGFDIMLEELLNSSSSMSAYPPYNIIRCNENDYEIQLAVAGFEETNISIEQAGGKLIIAGKKSSEEEVIYVHKGIANRNFIHYFNLGNHEVINAAMANGMLVVNIKRNTERKQISINQEKG